MSQDNSYQSPETTSLAKIAFGTFLVTGSGLLIALQLLATFGSSLYFIELFSHFQEIYFYCAIFGFGLALILKNRIFLILHTFLILFNLFLFYDFLPSISTEKPNSPILKIYQSNVLTSNKNSQVLLNQIEEHDPDIVLLIETNETWFNATKSLSTKYPHHAKSLKSNNFGFILYSKTPIVKTDITDFDTGIDCINSLIEWNNRTIRFIGAHPPPPMSRDFFKSRRIHLEQFASIINADPNTPSIICGDLNITPWSGAYSKLMRDADLISTRYGVGVLGTWPENLPIKIPIDHCLITKHFSVSNATVLPDIGSDHSPVLNEIYLSAQNTQNKAK